MRRDEYGSAMRFQVLGPVRVTLDGVDLALGGAKQRLVLALLVSAHGRAVSTDHLIDGVWGDDAPPTARKTVQGYVHHLRGQVGDRLKTESNGYSLATAGDIDTADFERLCREGANLVTDDVARAASLLREALGLWQGPAYADLRDQLVLGPEIARLEGLRLATVGDRIDADLAAGGHASLVGELDGLTQEYPLQERFRQQHMLALYRSGRQVEALRAYERARQFFAEEMGLEPSEALRDLETQVLARDPRLDPPPVVETGAVDAVRGYELRELLTDVDGASTYRAYQRSVGREVLLTVLEAAVADDPEFVANHLIDAKRIAEIGHPNINFVFDTWREPGRAYQVRRWLGGATLADTLATGPIPLAAASQTIEEVGGALAEAHRHNIAHGRLTSSSVRFDEAGHSYLADFSVDTRARDATVETDRVEFAALAYEMITATRPPPAADGYVPQPVAGVVEGAVFDVFRLALTRDGYARTEDFTRALRRAAGIDVVSPPPEQVERTDLRNPYKGLKAFQETDATDFHGRAVLTAKISAALESERLVAVVGPSGSGKSSVVKAGLVNSLRKAPHCLVSEMYPGAYPFEELESALERVSVHETNVMQDLLGDDRGLLRVLKKVLPDDTTELVLIIDQFEELFSMVRSDDTRDLFLDNLVSAVEDPRSRLRVVVTMRADFFDRPLEHAAFGRLVEAGLVPVTVPDGDELAEAIAAPARSVGVEFEDGLVPQIVNDVAGSPGALPLLQFALTELFDGRQTNTITLADYQGRGGVYGALGRRAEELYESLNPASRHSLRHALLRLVSVDDSSDDLRLRVRQADLRAEGIDESSLAHVLQLFGAHRLLTFDLDPITRGPTVEVAHEALLREWPRLADWIDDQRDDLVVRRRLALAMGEWRSAGEDSSYLPTGSRLAQFEEWSKTTDLALAPGERQFLQSAFERERDLAEAAAQKRRFALIPAVAAAVVLAGLAAFAFVQRSNANDAADVARAASAEAETSRAAAEDAAEVAQAAAAKAETSRLAATASDVGESLPQLGLLIAAEAHNRESNPETLGGLQRTLMEQGLLSRVVEQGEGFGTSDISADGDFLVVWDDVFQTQGPTFDLSGPEPVLIQPATAAVEDRLRELGRRVVDPDPPLFSYTEFERGGADLLVQYVEGVLTLYRDHDYEQPMLVIRNAELAYVSSPDATLFAIGKICATVEEFNAIVDPFSCPWLGLDVIDLATGDIVFTATDASNEWLSWSADGSLLYRVSDRGLDGSTESGVVTVWNTETWEEVAFVGEHLDDTISFLFAPSGGQFIAALTADGAIVLLDPDTGRELKRINGLIGAGDSGGGVSFSADGSLLISVLARGVRLWDTESGQQIGAPIPNDFNFPRSKSADVIALATEVGDVIHVWNLDTDSWFDIACEAAGRNMTPEEWAQFGPRDTEYRATCPQFEPGD